MSKYPFPFVECPEHPGKQRSYVSCVHVQEQNARISYFVEATDDNMGEALCSQEEHHIDLLRIACESHIKEKLYEQISIC